VAVEEVLRVEHDLSPVLFEERDRVGDHRQVLLQCRPQHGLDVEIPGLGDEGDRRRLCCDQLLQVAVVSSARAGEGGQPRVLERLLPQGGEELLVLGVRARPAALDVVDAELVQAAGDVQLVL
jgi:hypothetical protein